MDCYLCDNEAFQRCPRCGNPYCRDHGEDPSAGPGQGLCAACPTPANAAPSGAFSRASLLALLLGSVLALWLLVRPPGLPGESTEDVIPEASPQATATPTPSPRPRSCWPPPGAPGPPARTWSRRRRDSCRGSTACPDWPAPPSASSAPSTPSVRRRRRRCWAPLSRAAASSLSPPTSVLRSTRRRELPPWA